MVQPSRSGLGGMGRRRYQLMINDAPQSTKSQRSASPIIHELEEELLDEVANNEDAIISDIPNITSPPPAQDDDSCSLQSGSDPGSGRKSVDYLVDHIDDFEQAQSSSPLNNPYEDTLNTPPIKNEFASGQQANPENQRKRTFSGGDDAYVINKTARKKPGNISVHSNQATTGQKSLLKGQRSTGKPVNVKLESEQFGYVPDLSTTIQQKQTSSPSSSNGSGKSFYSKDDLFSDEIPNELFDDGSELLTSEAPMLSTTGLDISAGAYNPNTQINTLKSQNSAASTSSNNGSRPTLTLADGTNLQVAKFNGKSNTTDIAKINTATQLDSHLNDVQDDLDALKDILRGDNYQFDANALLNQNTSGGDQSGFGRYYLSQPIETGIISKLFNNDDVLPYEIPAVLDTTSVATVPPSATSPGTNAAMAEYQPVVDLSELLDIAAQSPDYDESNQTVTGS